MRKLISSILFACAAFAAFAASYGPYTPGEKVSESLPALVGYAAKGLPSGLKLNKKTGEISGAAKKPTGDVGVTVTFTKKGAETLTATFVVGPIPTISVTLAGDTEKCKVTGANKAYLVGKSVSLAAKGPKGTAFTGWFQDGEPWPNEDTYQTAKIKYVMTAESVDLVATFEKEQMVIDTSVLEAATLQVGTAVTEGAITVPVVTQSGLKTLAAKGLPSGLKLKLDKATGVASLAGTPKKAGTFTVTLKATAMSGAMETVALALQVGEKASVYPSWLVGSFDGRLVNLGIDNRATSNPTYEFIRRNWDWRCQSAVTLTVTGDGKVTVTHKASEYSEKDTGSIVSVSDEFAVIRIQYADGGSSDLTVTSGGYVSGLSEIVRDEDNDPTFDTFELYRRVDTSALVGVRLSVHVDDDDLRIDGMVSLEILKDGVVRSTYINNNSHYKLSKSSFSSQIAVLSHSGSTWKVGFLCSFLHNTKYSWGNDTDCLDCWLVMDIDEAAVQSGVFQLDGATDLSHDCYSASVEDGQP